jgi:CMP-N,N'-diacetyllegionaminic acid synthase
MGVERMKNIVAIIPARGGSKGIPRKNILSFCDRPLIAWSIEQAKASKFISDVFVSTDDDEIASVSQKWGAKIIRRPSELATDAAGSESAIVHAIHEIQRNHYPVSDVVFLQATSPVRHMNDIDKAVSQYLESGKDCLFSGTICDDFCFWKKDSSGKLDSWNFDFRNRGRRQDKQPMFLENGSIYIFKSDAFLNIGNRICGEIDFYEMPIWKSLEIDNLEEFDFLQNIMKLRVLKS